MRGGALQEVWLCSCPFWCALRLRHRSSAISGMHEQTTAEHKIIRLFAEHTILYLTISSEDHCRQLQDDLDALQK